ncbi:glycosyltransferase family 4 protein [Ideonella paludis]|uniref:Glycosyltransferase family 4 protein n=2 Tax=Ideonella paludis TaxID=1233411 RepID=A0ABS5E1C6_9BURK|nr:glycosyltransferase family 1 protein [Ideonella paludis]MBQ0937205.1 glycosyltransferase family 4 protein [Ideonella paludis]
MSSPSTSAAAPAQRIRLGVDFHVWDELFQGSRSHILGLYRAAIRLGPDIDFIFFLEGTDSLRQAHAEFAAPNVTLVRMPKWPGVLRLGLQLPWLQWRHKLDVLHMQYKLPLLRRGRFACTIHDVLFETHPQYFEPSFARQMHYFCTQAAQKSALLLTVSDYSRQEMVRQYGLAPEAIHVTANAVDHSRFYPGTDGEDLVRALGLTPGRYLLTVGRLEPRKNHVTLLKAYATLPPDSPPLVIVGQRDFQHDAVFETIAALGLNDRVKVLEKVSDTQLPAVLRHAQLFAYPTFAEGFGMPVLEAMASGVPVITANSTALPEVAGEAALLVHPSDEGGLAAAMHEVLNDDRRAEAMRQAGVLQAARFSWDASAQTLLAGIRHTCSGMRPSDGGLSAGSNTPLRP